MAFYTDGLTEVSVVNMALSKLGARSTISSMQENSAEGQAARLWFALSRSQTLQAYNWSFARKRAALTLTEDDQPNGTDTMFAFRYNYITDVLAVREIWNPMGKIADAIPYETEMNTSRSAKTILTNMPDAVGIFTIDVPEIQSWPAIALEALSSCLAYHMAFTLTGDRDLQNQMALEFNQWIRIAASHDSNESVDAPPRDAEWIRNR